MAYIENFKKKLLKYVNFQVLKCFKNEEKIKTQKNVSKKLRFIFYNLKHVQRKILIIT